MAEAHKHNEQMYLGVACSLKRQLLKDYVRIPLNPSGQLQSYSPIRSIHVAPFSHIWFSHSLIFIWQESPVKPTIANKSCL